MIRRVISGGQTGVDQAALLAARLAGFETGGFAARGWLVEEVDDAGKATGRFVAARATLEDFGLRECVEGETVAERMVARRRRNVADADLVLLLGDMRSAGSQGLLRDCLNLETAGGRRVPIFHVRRGETRPSEAVAFLRGHPRAGTLLVAGNRESAEPGIGERAYRFLLKVFEEVRDGST